MEVINMLYSNQSSNHKSYDLRKFKVGIQQAFSSSNKAEAAG